ncbi:helix-turn-helix transcriptional regulator [Arthrobacter koreensis]|uniref:Helix-turn-helix transcriptional regulator n=1 Tax=Arthrobacter koreensis TaxID=199136 RepID=A0ABY6FQP0_9MICC|nr:helix-turn-helix transcriptional regulator [Arthrobacter koreensis]UYB35487.1 helix-turn-helix transcriptional regulator [Arthrobacter koreensis]
MEESQLGPTAAVFGANMRRLREARGWKQSELARRMQSHGWPKYSQVAVSRTEEGTRAVRLDEAIALGELLGAGLLKLVTPPDEGRVVDELAFSLERVERTQSQVVRTLETLARQCNELEDAVAKAEEQAEKGWSTDQVAQTASDLVALARKWLQYVEGATYRLADIGDNNGEHPEKA